MTGLSGFNLGVELGQAAVVALLLPASGGFNAGPGVPCGSTG